MKKKILNNKKDLIDIERLVRDGKKINNEKVEEEYIKYKICEKMGWTYEAYDKTSWQDIELILKFIRLENYKKK